MKKTVILMISVICIVALSSCDPASEQKPALKPDASTSGAVEDTVSPAAVAVIPDSLVFTKDGSGKYVEPALGEWNAFLKKVFNSFDSGEVDPGSGIIKYYGEGNDGLGYCFIVSTRSDSTGIISYNIDTAIVSNEPNSGGDEVSGQEMVRWMYDHFQE